MLGSRSSRSPSGSSRRASRRPRHRRRSPPEQEEERTMQTLEQPAHRIEDARARLWLGSGPAAWGDIVRAVDPAATQSAAEMIAAAGLDWRVEQHPLEA